MVKTEGRESNISIRIKGREINFREVLVHYIYTNAGLLLEPKGLERAIGHLWSDQKNVCWFNPLLITEAKKVRKGLIRCNLGKQFIYG